MNNFWTNVAIFRNRYIVGKSQFWWWLNLNFIRVYLSDWLFLLLIKIFGHDFWNIWAIVNKYYYVVKIPSTTVYFYNGRRIVYNLFTEICQNIFLECPLRIKMSDISKIGIWMECEKKGGYYKTIFCIRPLSQKHASFSAVSK